MDVIKISWEVCQSLETYKVVGSKKVQSTTCKYPSCHLNLEPKKFLPQHDSSIPNPKACQTTCTSSSSFSNRGTMHDPGFGCPMVSCCWLAVGLAPAAGLKRMAVDWFRYLPPQRPFVLLAAAFTSHPVNEA